MSFIIRLFNLHLIVLSLNVRNPSDACLIPTKIRTITITRTIRDLDSEADCGTDVIVDSPENSDEDSVSIHTPLPLHEHQIDFEIQMNPPATVPAATMSSTLTSSSTDPSNVTPVRDHTDAAKSPTASSTLPPTALTRLISLINSAFPFLAGMTTAIPFIQLATTTTPTTTSERTATFTSDAGVTQSSTSTSVIPITRDKQVAETTSSSSSPKSMITTLSKTNASLITTLMMASLLSSTTATTTPTTLTAVATNTHDKINTPNLTPGMKRSDIGLSDSSFLNIWKGYYGMESSLPTSITSPDSTAFPSPTTTASTFTRVIFPENSSVSTPTTKIAYPEDHSTAGAFTDVSDETTLSLEIDSTKAPTTLDLFTEVLTSAAPAGPALSATYPSTVTPAVLSTPATSLASVITAPPALSIVHTTATLSNLSPSTDTDHIGLSSVTLPNGNSLTTTLPTQAPSITNFPIPSTSFKDFLTVSPLTTVLDPSTVFSHSTAVPKTTALFPVTSVIALSLEGLSTTASAILSASPEVLFNETFSKSDPVISTPITTLTDTFISSPVTTIFTVDPSPSDTTTLPPHVTIGSTLPSSPSSLSTVTPAVTLLNASYSHRTLSTPNPFDLVTSGVVPPTSSLPDMNPISSSTVSSPDATTFTASPAITYSNEDSSMQTSHLVGLSSTVPSVAMFSTEALPSAVLSVGTPVVTQFTVVPESKVLSPDTLVITLSTTTAPEVLSTVPTSLSTAPSVTLTPIISTLTTMKSNVDLPNVPFSTETTSSGPSTLDSITTVEYVTTSAATLVTNNSSTKSSFASIPSIVIPSASSFLDTVSPAGSPTIISTSTTTSAYFSEVVSNRALPIPDSPFDDFSTITLSTTAPSNTILPAEALIKGTPFATPSTATNSYTPFITETFTSTIFPAEASSVTGASALSRPTVVLPSETPSNMTPLTSFPTTPFYTTNTFSKASSSSTATVNLPSSTLPPTTLISTPTTQSTTEVYTTTGSTPYAAVTTIHPLTAFLSSVTTASPSTVTPPTLLSLTGTPTTSQLTASTSATQLPITTYPTDAPSTAAPSTAALSTAAPSTASPLVTGLTLALPTESISTAVPTNTDISSEPHQIADLSNKTSPPITPTTQTTAIFSTAVTLAATTPVAPLSSSSPTTKTPSTASPTTPYFSMNFTTVPLTTTSSTTTMASTTSSQPIICDKEISVDHRSVDHWHTPHYPDNYPEGITCKLTIKYPSTFKNGVVMIRFNKPSRIFSEDLMSCPGDRLSVDEDDRNGEEKRYCGILSGKSFSLYPKEKSWSTVRTLTFKSTSKDGGNDLGFSLKVTGLDFQRI